MSQKIIKKTILELDSEEKLLILDAIYNYKLDLKCSFLNSGNCHQNKCSKKIDILSELENKIKQGINYI